MAYVGKKPADSIIQSSDIQDGIITSGKLADNSVIESKLNTNAVTTDKVNADTITNAKTEFTPGLTIKGDGSSADLQPMPPRNFTCKNYMNKIKDGELFWVIR